MKNIVPAVSTMALLAMLLLAAAPPAIINSATAQKQTAATTTRPIEDFLSSQGQSSTFFPPVPDYVGWATHDVTRFALVDYAGLANEWAKENSGGKVSFGTTITGTITESPVDDSHTKVTVNLHTKNALAFAIDSTGGNLNGPVLFGSKAPDIVQNDGKPALVSSHLKVVFINNKPVGGELPDLVQLFLSPEDGQELLSYVFTAQGIGPLTESFEGVPAGTIGKLTIAQTFSPPSCQNIGNDCFPVEKISLVPLGAK